MTALQGGSRDEGSRPSRWRRGGEWCQARAAAEGASDAPLAKAQGSTIDNMLTNIIIVSGSKTTYQEKSWGMLSRITSLKCIRLLKQKERREIASVGCNISQDYTTPRSSSSGGMSLELSSEPEEFLGSSFSGQPRYP